MKNKGIEVDAAELGDLQMRIAWLSPFGQHVPIGMNVIGEGTINGQALAGTVEFSAPQSSPILYGVVRARWQAQGYVFVTAVQMRTPTVGNFAVVPVGMPEGTQVEVFAWGIDFDGVYFEMTDDFTVM